MRLTGAAARQHPASNRAMLYLEHNTMQQLQTNTYVQAYDAAAAAAVRAVPTSAQQFAFGTQRQSWTTRLLGRGSLG